MSRDPKYCHDPLLERAHRGQGGNGVLDQVQLIVGPLDPLMLVVVILKSLKV